MQADSPNNGKSRCCSRLARSRPESLPLEMLRAPAQIAPKQDADGLTPATLVSALRYGLYEILGINI